MFNSNIIETVFPQIFKKTSKPLLHSEKSVLYLVLFNRQRLMNLLMNFLRLKKLPALATKSKSIFSLDILLVFVLPLNFFQHQFL